MPAPDIRTTPRWLQPIAALVLLALGVYFLAGLHHTRRDGKPTWVVLGTWQMFTRPDRYHVELVAEAEENGIWREVDLREHFPYHWESGYRWERTSIYKSASRLAVFTEAACSRMDYRPSRIRLTELRWRQRLGRLTTKEDEDVRRTVLRTHTCGTLRDQLGQP